MGVFGGANNKEHEVNAKEALARTEVAAKIKASPIRAEINGMIAQAADEGKRSVCYFGHMNGALGIPLRHSLEEDGYAVNVVRDPDPGDPRSSSYLEISW
jgi:hypothetical protein